MGPLLRRPRAQSFYAGATFLPQTAMIFPGVVSALLEILSTPANLSNLRILLRFTLDLWVAVLKMAKKKLNSVALVRKRTIPISAF
jgi:hypothetical protein